MDKKFWLQRWRDHQLGWHREDLNPLLVEHWPSLGLPPSGKVLVPLCGKTLDMHFLAQTGHEVIGCELSPIAIEEFFEEASMPFESRREARFVRHSGEGITIFQGDVFELDRDLLAGVTGVFDRGAMIALPSAMRGNYAAHLIATLPDSARILLLTLEYDQSLVGGPPFSVPGQEVREVYSAKFEVEKLVHEVTKEVPPRFAEVGLGGPASPVSQVVWKLTRR